MTREEALNGSVSMKVGLDYCLSHEKRVAIHTDSKGNAYGAPYTENGKTYVSLKALLDGTDVAYTEKDGAFEVAGKSVKPVLHTDCKGNTYPVIEINEIEGLLDGWYLTYDDLGLVVVAREPDLLSRNNLTELHKHMCKFVFDYAGVENVYDDFVKKTGKKHPYLRREKEYIDWLRKVYESNEGDPDYDKTLKKILDDIAEKGEKSYREYAKPDADGEYKTYVGQLSDDDINSDGMHGGVSLIQPHLLPAEKRTRYKMDGDKFVLDENGNKIVTHFFEFDQFGYEMAGGRMDAASRTTQLNNMAWAYVLTGDMKYVRCAYDAAVRLGDWITWGTGHFLSIGGAGIGFATFYDLMYNAIEELGKNGEICPFTNEPYNTKKLREIMYEKVIKESNRYGLARQGLAEYRDYDTPVKKGYKGVQYQTAAHNWNPYCIKSILACASCVLDADESEGMRELTEQVVKDEYGYFTKYGAQAFMPDGGYYEGPGYWCGSATPMYQICMLLDSCCGTDYNITNAAGIIETSYFGLHVEGNDGLYFAFNDTFTSAIASDMFFYVGQKANDETLIAMRMESIESGLKNGGILDALYYPKKRCVADKSKVDYYSRRIDLFTARKSFDRGALFAGMIGGENNMTHSHVDALTFAVYSSNTCWLMDIGTENYNSNGFWGADTRYRYYKMKPEGHNTIAVASKPNVIPYGQDKFGYAKAYEWCVNEMSEGAYAKFDGTNALGGVAESWKRGMLLTNDRNTVVIQDELSFHEEENAYWSAHYISDHVKNVELSEDGRTAYMYSAKNDAVLRVAIVSDDESLKFEIWDTYTTVHQRTDDKNSPYFIHEKNYNPDFFTYAKEEFHPLGTPHGQYNRDKQRKLVIRSEDKKQLNVAVVFEEIDKNNESALGYSWCEIDSDGWIPKKDER